MEQVKIAVFLAIICAVFLPLVHIIVSKISPNSNTNNKALIYGIASYILIWCSTISLYLFFIRPQIINFNGFISGFSTVSFIILGYLEFSSLMDRGFSLRLIIEIYLKNKPLTVEELTSVYSDGKGLNWMISKRLNSMTKLNVISVDNNLISIKALGILIGKCSLRFKKIVKMGKGG